jgi:trehalose/maltose hydrolase-like predicted phosphorylase
VDGFSLSYDRFDPEAEGLREALSSTGNGYLCTRGAAEWEDADGVHIPAPTSMVATTARRRSSAGAPC